MIDQRDAQSLAYQLRVLLRQSQGQLIFSANLFSARLFESNWT
jgi:hypothetical protein